jgi:TatD DNase family protein
MTPIVDIGANLTNRAFSSDLDQVIARAFAAGVGTIVVTGTTAAVSKGALALARTRPGRLFATAGVHPHHASEVDDAVIEELRALQREPEIVAVGECGLDYDRNYSPQDDQRRAFAAQLALAGELGRPVFLHERSAHADFAAILREHRSSLPRGVVHCFTGTAEELDAYLALDMHIGITGWICDDRRGAHLRELVGRIPADRLMIETDAPYLLPRDLKPMPKNRRNEPGLLPYVLRAVASARGESVDHVATHTAATSKAFFELPE